MFWKKIKFKYWLEILSLTAISGLVYIPRFGQLTFQKDDWYFIYDGLVGGPKFFLDLTLHTRPARGPLYEFLFSLFNIQPLPYHISLYFLRLAGGLGALWLFNLLWLKQRRANFFMAVLFLVFPGFLWWLGAFEFQPYVLSLALQVFSIIFTLKFLKSSSAWERIIWAAFAIISGWYYLALVEYAIGMEFFRLLCVYLFIKQESPQLNFGETIFKSLKAIALFWIIPLGFVTWYQFFFDNWRKAQEAGAQISQLFASPLTLFWWLVRLFQSTLNVSVLAWAVPFQENFFTIRLSDILFAFFFAALVIAILLLSNRQMEKTFSDDEQKETGDPLKGRYDALIVGLLGTIGGILPIVVANRVVTFERYSHYALPASLAGVILLGALVHSIFPKRIRLLVLSGLIGIAALTHHAVAAQAVAEEKAVRDFWWQVTWRAPSISTNTTLVVMYPNVDYADGDEVVWGPANSIYHPEKQSQVPIVVPISASRMESNSIINIVMAPGAEQKTDLIIKDVTLNYYFKNILLMTQPSDASCVHVIDKRWPELSTFDDAFAIASSSKSNIDNVTTTGKSPTPPKAIFGSEPARDYWCYYYQKAELARQQGNWKEVAALGDKAQKLGLHPNDQIEWTPFLQAYAYQNDSKKVQDISTKINTVGFYQYQTCQNVASMNENGYPLQPDMIALTDKLFCPPKK